MGRNKTTTVSTREKEGSFRETNLERAGFETESLRVTSLNKKFERHREKFETRIEQNLREKERSWRE